jgi:hypothetical protein
MDHDDRKGMFPVDGDLVFDVDLPDHMLFGMRLVVMTASIENTCL